ncbi:MAG TPA: hypothetical protein PL182_11710, partial [Pseudobdellovibrionaceae bacterium]|nr:hypothetical protein [Pseudobdellovibrionaceae bacterium]
ATSQYFTYAPNGSSCTAGQILKWNNSRWECGADANSGGTITAVTATAPLTVTGTTSRNIAIANGSTTGQMLRWNGSAWETSTVGTQLTALNASNLGSGTVPPARMPALTGDVTMSAGTTATTLANSGVTAGTYGSATVVPRMTVDAKGRVTSVTNTTITGVSPVGASLANGRIWVGNGTAVAAAVAVSGDATLSNAGALTIAANAITSAKIANGAVANADLANGAVTAQKTDTSTCNANNAGMTRVSGGVFQYCNGSAWTTVTAAAGAACTGGHEHGKVWVETSSISTPATVSLPNNSCGPMPSLYMKQCRNGTIVGVVAFTFTGGGGCAP